MSFAGGPVFWILVILALVAVFTYIDRMVDLRRARIDYQDFLKGVFNVLDSGNDDEALSMCEDVSAPVAHVVVFVILSGCSFLADVLCDFQSVFCGFLPFLHRLLSWSLTPSCHILRLRFSLFNLPLLSARTQHSHHTHSLHTHHSHIYAHALYICA